MSPSTYKFLADGLVLFHLTFVAFVVVGGLLALRWRWIALLHVPAVVWVIYAEGTGTLCPLTPLENDLREMAFVETYEGGFVDHYIMPVLYPEGLTRQTQYAIAVGLLVLHGTCYSLYVTFGILRRRRARERALAEREAEPRQEGEPGATGDGGAPGEADGADDARLSQVRLHESGR